MNRLSRTIVLMAALLCPTSAPAAEFKLDGKTFTLPDGFTLEKVAGPALVDRPIVADFDERGRLYVADSSGSNDSPKVQLEKKPHRIVRLEDTDGDGKYDKRTIFADKMMFPEGAMWLEGSLYVAAPPQIWKLTDTNDDGVADRREVWFDGKTLTGCANDLHGPYRGPDGRIYWCKGAFAEQRYERPGKEPFVTRAAHIFRAKPDGTEIEPIMTGGMDNPVDVVFTPGGEPIFSCTFLQHPAEGRRDGLIHAVYGGVWGKTNDALEGHVRTGPDLMPVMTHLGPAAPCGLTRAESDGLGFKDNLFCCQFNMRKVSRHVLIADGSTFKTNDYDFLVSPDHDFHPTDVVEDADGSLLVVDTGGWYKLCCPTSQLEKPDVLGAIYRVRKVGAPKLEDPRGLGLDWRKPSVAELVGRLADGRPSVRRRASETIARGEADYLPSLDDMLRVEQDPATRLAVIWTLARIDGPRAREIARRAILDPDETVRQAAAHAAALWRDQRAIPTLAVLLGTNSAMNRRAAAEAYGRIAAPWSPGPIFQALEMPTDRPLEHALIYALTEQRNPFPTILVLRHDKPVFRRAAMIALDRKEGGVLDREAVIAELASPEAANREAAAWVAGHHPEWGGTMARWFADRLRSNDLTEAEREALAHQLAKLAKAPEVRDLIGATLVDPDSSPEARGIALKAIGEASPKALPAEWAEGLAASLASKEGWLVRVAVATVRRLGIKKEESGLLAQRLLDASTRADLPESVRIEALAAVPGGPGALSPALFDLALKDLDPERPVASRLMAADALARAKLDGDQLARLAPLLAKVGPLEVDRLLPAFARSTDEALGLAAVAALGRSSFAGSLRADVIRPHIAKYGPAVQAKAEELYVKWNVDAARQKARVDELLATLPRGDIRRGQAVFNGAKAACLSCHEVGYVGGKVGPDLTQIGKIRQPRDLIEAIVYPSASFVRSYEPVVVATRDGRSVSGVVRRDSSDEVVVATGPDREERIARDAIEEVRPGSVSVMPAGLDGQLSAQELADLLAFLLSRK
ncbi:MAG TPA: PVC-type heme-binding CxxCH protein [Isosphaeraceae bacterium]